MLLQAAAKIFAEQGYHSASVEQVAEQAGFSKGAVYSNFESKDDLFLALVEAYSEERLRLANQEFETVGEGVEARVRMGGKVLAGLIDQDSIVLQLHMEFWSNAARDAELRKRLAAFDEQSLQAVVKIIVGQLSQVEGKPLLPVEQIAETLMVIADGFMLHRILNPERFPKKYYEDVFTLVLSKLLLGH